MTRGVKRIWSDLGFMLSKSKHLSPPDQPMLDPGALSLFEDILSSQDVDTYVEYGAGGGTLHAAKRVGAVVSVESDKQYLGLVRDALAEDGSGADVHLIHGPIGPTTRWGYPFFRAGRYAVSGRSYVNAPWRVLEALDRKADFILVDGRYRMACVCAALLHPRAESALILLDDFKGRAYYGDVLSFTDVIDRKGSGILVRRKEDFDADACRAVFEKSLRDCR